MDVCIDEVFFLRVLNFINSIMESWNVKTPTNTVHDINEFFPEVNVDRTSKMIYIKLLHIKPIRLNFSFANVPGIDRVNDSRISKVLRRGGALANIDSAPLQLNGLILQHPFTTRWDLVFRILKHYFNSGLREFHKVLGSADILGSPISLMNSLGTGIYDFFHEPYEGIATHSTKQFLIGCARGTQSLVKNSIYGVFNTTSKITGTVSKGMAQLSFDREYIRDREWLHRQQPRHAGEGFVYGIRDFSTGIFQALAGLVAGPVRGAMNEGLPGFVKGVARGVSGVTIKPAVGTLDLLTRTTEGIRNTASYLNDQKRHLRKRPPRYFGPDSILLSFSLEKSEGQELLSTIEEGKFQKESYLFHMKIVQQQRVVLVSNLHVFYVKVSMEHPANIMLNPFLDWRVLVKDIKVLYVSEAEKGIVILLRNHQSNSLFETPSNKRLIHAPSAQVEAMFHKLQRVLCVLKHPSITTTTISVKPSYAQHSHASLTSSLSTSSSHV
eukprot:TRINITY_DN10380_c0_g1_i1.p1 TRINITY_DN10380_c0_g1~~TRINITY_DN10380_c0_g1_i1.p1  ORF type:complete len:564 (-),score=101.04 TRINITY_DN10380_c0_g1_i1:75-1562(-)